MTKGELIEYLKQFPDDTIVQIYDEEDGFVPLNKANSVYIENGEYYDIDKNEFFPGKILNLG